MMYVLYTCACLRWPADVTDEDLEAELLALEGKGPNKGGGKSPGKGKGTMSLEQIDQMVAGLPDVEGEGEEGGGESGDSDLDDDELLRELEVWYYLHPPLKLLETSFLRLCSIFFYVGA